MICFGDPSMLINGLTVSCHEYTSRLFTYLLGGGCTPQAAWRQLAGLAAVTLLLASCWGTLCRASGRRAQCRWQPRWPCAPW